ncbi:MAG: GNAT family N-acetyltransferase [Anaerolineales bacterium]|nr:GNAT family N-acetyltransferase [Anaerolineales bacterium]
MHQFAWQEIITRSYGHSCHMLIAQQSGQVTGVLALIEIRSLLTGHSLQSLPGGLCATSASTAAALIEAAEDLAKSQNVAYLLLHDCRHDWPAATLESVSAHRTIRVTLKRNPEEVFKNMPRNVRRYVQKAQRLENIRTVVQPAVDAVHLQDFYRVFVRFNYEMGTPPFGFDFLHNVVKAFPLESLVTLVYVGRDPVAGFFCLEQGNLIFGIWGSALPAYRDYYPTHLAYWAMIEYGCQAGFTDFELGRAPYPSGFYDFKANWGDRHLPVYQLYRVYRGKQPAVVQVGIPAQDSTSLSMFRRAWRKLPYGLVLHIGPLIRWHMPFG